MRMIYIYVILHIYKKGYFAIITVNINILSYLPTNMIIKGEREMMKMMMMMMFCCALLNF